MEMTEMSSSREMFETGGAIWTQLQGKLRENKSRKTSIFFEKRKRDDSYRG